MDYLNSHEDIDQRGPGAQMTATPSPRSLADRATADADDRTRQARGARRRTQILDAAVELFAARGFRAGGVADLADRVGLTPPGVLYYFGTKERLLREVVAERDRVDLSTAPDDLRLADLRDAGAHNVHTATLMRLFVVLAAESFDPGDPLHDFFVDRYELVRTIFADLLRREQELGTARDGLDVEAIARDLVAAIIGLEVQWLMDPDRFDLGVAVAGHVDRLLESIAP
jgi:AcrR family transcriptional regulator